MAFWQKRRERPRPASAASSQTTSTKRYRESTHLIPTPGVERVRPAQEVSWAFKPWNILTLTIFMIVVGIGIEVALAIAKRDNGFTIPQRNIFPAQASFLTSFFPTLLVFPLAYTWQMVDRVYRLYQPYVLLAKGGQRAEDSLLVDYLMANAYVSMFKTVKRREWIIFFSLFTALVTTLFQPLAGALLAVKEITMAQPTTLQGTTDLGLIPDINDLNAFLAAAGFTEAAAFQGLPDPPFVASRWATAQFQFPANPGVNASVTVNTTGILTDAGCQSTGNPRIDTSNPNNYTLTASSGADGCQATSFFNPKSSSQQYGTAGADPVSCGLPADIGQEFAPVMFWFYRNNTETNPAGVPQGSAVICRPIVQLFNIEANVNLNNGSLIDVVIENNYTKPNNISGPTLNGKVYNAVLFGNIPDDSFVQARATAIGAQIPGAIFRLASQNASVLEQYFDSGDGFLNLTETIYTQHLSVSAKTVYFVNADFTLPATKMSQMSRLTMDELAAHALAVLLIIIGLTGTVIHFCHRHVRRRLYLTTPPGKIATVVALTAHSGFGELLLPYDDEAAVRKKLEHLRFSLDRRTGAVVADEYGYLGDMGSEEDDAEKVELNRMGAMDALVGEKGGVTVVSRSNVPEDFPYEHEPLVVSGSRNSLRGPEP